MFAPAAASQPPQQGSESSAHLASARPWLDRLNPAQLAAVSAGTGPVLVIAGAGSGKTLTLACRVAFLIDQGVPPEKILLLTFSRRAAREMLSRADRLVQPHRTGRVWGGTFHAVANRLLRLHAHALHLNPGFGVLDQADSADLMDLIRGEHVPEAAKRNRRFPRKDTLATIYSRMVNASTPLSAVLESTFPWCRDEVDGIRAIFGEYTRRKRAQNLLDYDDLLLFWRALAASPAGEAVAEQFDHVLVDEYQDTNPLQAEILLGLRRTNRNIMVVGDDAQAIYSFRAASVRNIFDFPRQFAPVQHITLAQNYRSTAPILEASNAVIALARERFPKDLLAVRPGGARPVLVTCSDEAAQSQRVCDNLLECREQGIPLKQQVVLFRAGHHSDLLELELTRRNIPYVKFGGLKFLESAHVKDVLAVMRVLDNARDEVSWFRVLQLLDGIGPAGARAIIASIGVHSADADPLRRLLQAPPRVPEPAREPLDALRTALSDCLAASATPAVEIGRLRPFLEPIFERKYSSAAARLQDVDQLEQVASAHTSRARFLSELALDPPSSTSDLAGPPLLDEDYVVLSTVHSAKGGEWDVVHLIHAADGMFPSDMSTGDVESIEEERRLFYVALTRARDRLNVYFALRFYRHPRGSDDTHHFAQLTRFLPPGVQHHFDRATAGHLLDPVLAERSRSMTPAPSAAARVDASLASLWDA